MTSALVLRNDADGVATLTLNRPDKLNALNPSVFVELRQHLDKIAEDSLVKCVVLTGSGRAFCAGHDLEAIANHERAPSKHFEPETVDALERLPQPTIAQLHGHCYTGGLELALACDLLIADETARRHSRTMGARANLGDVYSPAGTSRCVNCKRVDVHEPTN